MTNDQKEIIDNMTYEAMLALWRFAPSGHPLFHHNTGLYFTDVMLKKKQEIGNDKAVAISKQLGWDQGTTT